MGNRNERYFNSSGYRDPTACEALQVVSEEEKRVAMLMQTVKMVLHVGGFELVGAVSVRERKSGKVYQKLTLHE